MRPRNEPLLTRLFIHVEELVSSLFHQFCDWPYSPELLYLHSHQQEDNYRGTATTSRRDKNVLHVDLENGLEDWLTGWSMMRSVRYTTLLEEHSTHASICRRSTFFWTILALTTAHQQSVCPKLVAIGSIWSTRVSEHHFIHVVDEILALRAKPGWLDKQQQQCSAAPRNAPISRTTITDDCKAAIFRKRSGLILVCEQNATTLTVHHKKKKTLEKKGGRKSRIRQKSAATILSKATAWKASCAEFQSTLVWCY